MNAFTWTPPTPPIRPTMSIAMAQTLAIANRAWADQTQAADRQEIGKGSPMETLRATRAALEAEGAYWDACEAFKNGEG